MKPACMSKKDSDEKSHCYYCDRRHCHCYFVPSSIKTAAKAMKENIDNFLSLLIRLLLHFPLKSTLRSARAAPQEGAIASHVRRTLSTDYYASTCPLYHP